jgi:predicted nuclease of predicted toxin-antitoxin system
MKLLLDQNISYRLVRDLKFIVSELDHVKFVGLQDAEDYEIWEYAKHNGKRKAMPNWD